MLGLFKRLVRIRGKKIEHLLNEKKKLKLKLIFCQSRTAIKEVSDSILAAKRSAIQASFEEKVNNYLESIVEFSILIKYIHDIWL